MLIDEENIRVQYDSTAESPIMKEDVLPFPFRYIEKEQIKAILLDGTELVFNEDYTVGYPEEEKPEGEDEASVSADTTVVVMKIDIPVGETITLYRETALDQTSEFPQEARFSSRKIEDALDKLTMQNQEQREALARALKLPLTAPIDVTDLALPNPEPNKSVKWNAEGTALVNTNFDPDTALVTTENFKKQAETAANNANQSAQAAAGSAAVAAQKENTINTISTDYLNQINDRGTTILKDADAIINRVGLNLFDTVVKDHILTYPDGKGLALQGTWVYRDAIAGSRYGYPDFYEQCVKEYDESAKSGSQTITLGGKSISMLVHTNGHMYYTASTQEALDAVNAWYSTFGTAWFYGLDKTNKRVFLPRNNWFDQYLGNSTQATQVGLSVQAGLPNITGTLCNGKSEASTVSGAFTSKIGSANAGAAIANYNGNIFTLDASRSSAVYGRSTTVQPIAVRKLLYICVGNQMQDHSWVDVVTQVNNGAKEIEDKRVKALADLESNRSNAIDEIEKDRQQALSDLDAKENTGLASLANASNALRNTQITECFLETPSRINLILNSNGTITLKAGSVVTVPSGFEADGITKKFDYITVENDVIGGYTGYTFTGYVCYRVNDGQLHIDATTKDPNAAGNFIYYNSAQNLVQNVGTTGNSTHKLSLPIAVVSLTEANGVVSIQDIFDSFGYIAGRVWVSKGSKGLSSNGLNPDGTLNNSEVIFNNTVITEEVAGQSNYRVYIKANGGVRFAGISSHYTQDTQPVLDSTYAVWYSPRENLLRFTNNKGSTWEVTSGFIPIADIIVSDTALITKCTFKHAFRAVNYYDLPTAVVQTYCNGTSWFRVWSDGWIEQGGRVTAVGATVTFLKPFSNTSYNAQITPGYNNTAGVFNWAVTGKTNKTMVVNSSDTSGATNRPCDWYACGY